MTTHFVATGYVVKDGKTLLLWHKKLKMWLPPGGHIEENELPDEALLREIREETGLEVEIVPSKRTPDPSEEGVSYLHVPSHVQLEVLTGHGRHIDLIYFCRVLSGTEAISASEHDAMRWCGPKDLEDPQIRAEVRDTGLLAIQTVSSF
jgi:8-oxo-dGTP pyrophosphatase MutT (NUDIX family)